MKICINGHDDDPAGMFLLLELHRRNGERVQFYFLPKNCRTICDCPPRGYAPPSKTNSHSVTCPHRT